MRRILLLSFLYISSCAHTPPNCLSPESEDFKRQLNTLERVLSVANNHTTPDLVSHSCKKYVYRQGAYSLVLYTDSSGHVLGNASKWTEPKELELCWEKALAEIGVLQIPFAERILSRSEKERPETWSDPDIGPRRWISCRNEENPENFAAFEESLGTLLHEESHLLRHEDCIFLSSAKDLVCFAHLESFPDTRLGRLERFPIHTEAAVPSLKLFQDIYLAERQAFINLIDEVQAYSTTTFSLAQVIRTRGRSAVYWDKNNPKVRSYIALPQLLNHTMVYLERLKDSQPKLYYSFVKDQQNKQNLRMLLNLAESSYQSWVTTIATVGEIPKEPETSLWKSYLSKRKKLRL